MDFLKIYSDQLPSEKRKIEQVCESFDMDCVGLDHEACWRGVRGTMPCCGRVVEFERVRGICPFLWLKDSSQ